jgi:peptide subunit release factor 1 (eRF1)
LLADPIAELRSPSGSLISVYLGRPSPGGMTALLTDLLRPVREAAESKERSVQKSVRADAERIHDHAEQLEVDAAPAYAIFASDLDGLFTVESLGHKVPNVSSLGPRPYLRPLRAAPKALRAGVIVADRSQARVFVVSGQLIDEVGPPLIADIGKHNYGGFSGYEEHGVRLRADEVSTRMWREAGAILLEKHQERPFDYLAIGGHGETVEEIGRNLHPYLDRVDRATFHAGPQSLSFPALRVELASRADEVSRRRESALAERVCDTARSDGLGVLGLTPVLTASNSQAIDTLVVAGEFGRPGSICNSCGFLARSGNRCPVCGSTMFQVDDIVAAAMEATVAAGGRTHQIVVSSPLDAHGIGALTRFPQHP